MPKSDNDFYAKSKASLSRIVNAKTPVKSQSSVKDLAFGAENPKELLQFETGPGGIEITVSRGDGIQASLKDGKGAITYKETCHFFRGLGLFIEAAREKKKFRIEETPRFEKVGVMLDEMIRTGIGNECAPYNLVAEISLCLLKAIPQMGRI